MYSDQDIDLAVAAGAISADAAAAFRQFVGRHRAGPDEEQFRLLTGFNDIFVAIALLVFLIALAWLSGRTWIWLGAAAVTAASWGLAEYFTRQRRMALPSIVLVLGFAAGTATLLIAVYQVVFGQVKGPHGQPDSPLTAVIGVLLVGAVYLHWRRFQVPISVAIGATTAMGTALFFLASLVPGLKQIFQPLLFVGGLGLFAAAMYWDVSDPQRVTRRTDTAFWLHLAAAPVIVHAAFGFGFNYGEGAPGRAILIVATYLLMTLVALVIDRRAMLTAALAYVLYAMSVIIRDAASPALSFALSGLVIGASLLMLSAFWNKSRRVLVSRLPARWRAVLPSVG